MVGIELAIDPNDIAAELLCSIGKTLPFYPVVTADGCIYERSKVLDREFYPSNQIKNVIKILVNSRNLDEKYLGLWAIELAPFPSPSPSFDEEIEAERREEVATEDETIDAKDEGKVIVENNEANVKKDVDESDAHIKGNESDNITFITTKAEAGNTDSMVALGEVYVSRSTKENEEQAYYWFDKASENGNALGTARKADCLLLGRGVAECYQDGYELLLVEAGSKDSAPALLRLGYYWSTGILGFKQNENKAEKKGYGRLRKIAPHLSDGDIEQMAQDLASLIGHVDDSDNAPRANAKALQSVAETKTTSENPNKTSSNMSFATTNSSTETQMPVEASNVSKTRSITASDEAGDEINIKKETPKVNADSEAKPATASDDTDGKSTLSQSAPTTGMPGVTGHVKLCFECKQSKPQAGYTASQWKKCIGTGRCVACVSKTVQWQTSGIGNSLQVKPCGHCSVSKPHTDFSPNQWRKVMGTGRCKECVNKSLPNGG